MIRFDGRPRVVPFSAREHVLQLALENLVQKSQGLRSWFNTWKGGRAELQPRLLLKVLSLEG